MNVIFNGHTDAGDLIQVIAWANTFYLLRNKAVLPFVYSDPDPALKHAKALIA